MPRAWTMAGCALLLSANVSIAQHGDIPDARIASGLFALCFEMEGMDADMGLVACGSFIRGVVDGTWNGMFIEAATRGDRETRAVAFCAPETETTQSLIDAFREWSYRNQGSMDIPSAAALTMAVQEAFPC